eukprot:CAMPEP_0176003840 /NCGR_PEP_ID=MMETSP0120_2-20121206/1381_1 /TAXON_ID=160619 /ORGANISM="Kryptoperidinium foliaceum, Strain CCMP 1326" /LENGTH=411 /DNA_ID=CAMNT_0017336495 /DNA_START=66 /DNA_END=1301 /DNA_ORIENTATION=-
MTWGSTSQWTLTNALATTGGSSSLETSHYDVPLLHKILDRIALLSPRTWYGILDSQTRSPFNQFDETALAKAAVAIAVPLWLLAHGLDRFGSIRQKEFLWRMILPAFLISPWNLSVLLEFITQLRRLIPPLYFYYKGRMEALDSAVQTRVESIRQRRMQTFRRYDVYWPQNRPGPEEEANAVLMLPGFGISHWAYAEVASRLSDSGFVVVVASMEPIRVAHPHLGSDVVSMARILDRVQGGSTKCAWKWHLLGHSAGSFAAMHLYKEFSKSPSSSTHPISSRIALGKLVLWGCSAMVGWSTDISEVTQTKNDEEASAPSVLIIQGTQDSLVELMKANQEEFSQHFPSDTQTVWIEGGTHQGFASYNATWEGTPADASAIPYMEQQRQACEKTTAFILPRVEEDELSGDEVE